MLKLVIAIKHKKTDTFVSGFKPLHLVKVLINKLDF